MKFDARTQDMKRMEGNDISNPLIASWITSFIRCVIGESLHGIQLLVGNIVSIATDGFITDIKDLENKFIKHNFFNKSLFMEYRKLHNQILELKNEGVVCSCDFWSNGFWVFKLVACAENSGPVDFYPFLKILNLKEINFISHLNQVKPNRPI